MIAVALLIGGTTVCLIAAAVGVALALHPWAEPPKSTAYMREDGTLGRGDVLPPRLEKYR